MGALCHKELWRAGVGSVGLAAGRRHVSGVTAIILGDTSKQAYGQKHGRKAEKGKRR